MKKLILLAITAMMSMSVYSQNVVRKGNVFTAAKAAKDTLVTKFQYQDSKCGIYPIIINKKNGHCYIIKKSQKSGKYYRVYFTGKNKEYISTNICDELGIKYIPTKK